MSKLIVSFFVDNIYAKLFLNYFCYSLSILMLIMDGWCGSLGKSVDEGNSRRFVQYSYRTRGLFTANP